MLAIGLCACLVCFAETGQSSPTAEEVVSRLFEHLRAGDVGSMDPLFFRIPIMERNEAAWLALLESVSQKVRDDRLDWEVICGKELEETAVVIVNQTMKYGNKHADPDAVYLVKEQDGWMLLPDIFAPNAKDEVRSALSDAQARDQFTLQRWAVGEIRGMTTDCVRESAERS